MSRMASVSQLRPPSSSSLRSTPLLARSHGNQSTSTSNAAISRQTDSAHGALKSNIDVAAPSRSANPAGGMAADRPQASLRRSNLPTGTASSKLAPAQDTLRRPQRLATPKAGLTIPQEASSLHSQSTVLSPPLDYPHAGGKNQPPLTPFTTEPRDPTTPGLAVLESVASPSWVG